MAQDELEILAKVSGMPAQLIRDLSCRVSTLREHTIRITGHPGVTYSKAETDAAAHVYYAAVAATLVALKDMGIALPLQPQTCQFL